VRDYAWLEEEPVGTVDTGPQPTKFAWVHTDRLGTPLAVTSSPATGNAATIWRASYAPFGLATTNEDPDGDLQAFTMNLRLPGQRWDHESGLHYNFLRTFDGGVGRYSETDPIDQIGGLNLYVYTDSNPANAVDTHGLYSALEAQLDVGNFLTGVADAASLGLGPLARDQLAEYDWGGYVEPCSAAYSAGEWASLGLGLARLGYAAAARVVSRGAASAAGAVAGRNMLKKVFRAGLAGNYRKYSYAERLAKYGTDDAVRDAAGRTNAGWNALGTNSALGSALNPCGCEE
jgi:RHS repeat-associated protein